MNIPEIKWVCVCVDWSDVAQNRDMWQALVYPIMQFPVLQNVGNFLTS